MLRFDDRCLVVIELTKITVPTSNFEAYGDHAWEVVNTIAPSSRGDRAEHHGG